VFFYKNNILFQSILWETVLKLFFVLRAMIKSKKLSFVTNEFIFYIFYLCSLEFLRKNEEERE